MIKRILFFTNNSKTNSIQESWEEFELIRKIINSKLDESHQSYISQLLEVDKDGERKTPVIGHFFLGNKYFQRKETHVE